MTLIYDNAEQPEQNWSMCDVKHITNPNKKTTLRMSKKETTTLQNVSFLHNHFTV